MKASELRIGNITEYKITDSLDERKEWWELNKVDVFDLQHLVEFPDDGFFRPIPLTEEWILKFGFEKDVLGRWFKEGLKGFITKYVNYGKTGYQYQFNHYGIADCWFVHQLQNLYFYLCGKELLLNSE